MATADADPPGHPPPATVRGSVAALVAYAVLVAALTWPLLPNASDHMSATHEQFHFDTLHTAWMLAHESHSLAAPWSVVDARIYHPEPRTLFYSTLSLGLLPYFAPTYLLTANPTLAIDLAFLACAVLTAWTIHLVVRRWTGDPLAAAAGGVTFLVTPTVLWGFPSAAPYFAVLQYQPLIVLAASTAGTGPVLAALVALQALADPLYVAPAVGLPLLALALVRIARPATRGAGVRLLGLLAVAGLVLVPIYAGYLDVLLRNPDLRAQSLYAEGEAPAAARAGPSAAFVAWGYVVSWWYRFEVPLAALAVVALGAVAFLARRDRADAGLRNAWLHCAAWTLAALALPLLHEASPVLRGIVRGGIVGLIALALLTGLGTAECMRIVRARFGPVPAVACAIAFLALLLALPLREGRAYGRYPIQPTPPLDTPIVAALRGTPGPVLEIPADRVALNAPALYRATAHRRRLLNGYSSYYPAAARRRLAQIKRLPDPLALQLLAVETGVTTLVVHPLDLDPRARAAWERVKADPTSRKDLQLRVETEDALVYDVHRR